MICNYAAFFRAGTCESVGSSHNLKSLDLLLTCLISVYKVEHHMFPMDHSKVTRLI